MVSKWCFIPLQRGRSAHFHFIGSECVMVSRLKSVEHGQCAASPTVTFPVAEDHLPLTDAKLYCLVTEVRAL